MHDKCETKETTMSRFNKEEKTLIAATTMAVVALIATVVWCLTAAIEEGKTMTNDEKLKKILTSGLTTKQIEEQLKKLIEEKANKKELKK